uniref:YcdB/YcdC domain-containing protein n=1 Tax=Paenibacillus silviterrae TaxID=3242194 RepID=UPI002543574A
MKYERMWRRAGVTVMAAALGTSLIPVAAAESVIVPVVTSISGSAPARMMMSAGGLTTANPVESLEAKFTKEQAIEKTRALFPKLKEAEVQNVELGSGGQYPPAQTAVWSITWQMQYENGSHGFQSQMDATNGDLLQIHIGGPSLSEDGEPYYPPKLTREQAVEEAKSFIAKASGSMNVSELKLNEQKQPRRTSLFGPIEYQFSFTRHVNGIPSHSESVGISLTGNGQVTSFYRHGGSAVYPSPVPAYSAEEALQRFKEQFQLQLAYIPKGRWGMSSTTEYFLGWQPVNKEIYTLDALTGDFLLMSGEAKPASSVQGFQAVPKQGVVYTAASGELTKEKAEERVRQLKLIPENMLLSKEASSAQEHYPTGRKSWRLHWSEDGKPVFADNTWSAVVDATSGQIMELRKENYSSSSVMNPGEKAGEQPKTPSITEEAARSKAFDLINQLYPNAADELKWMKGFVYGPSSNDHAFQFTFQRYVHDIMVVGNQIHMTLNGDGQLASYYVSGMSEPSSVPKLEPVVTEEQARKQYEEKLEMELHYQSFHPDMAAGVQAKPIVKLVYSPKLRGHEDGMGTVIDAVTGEFRSMWESSLSEGGSDRKPAD